jgi:hypothetical protein
VLIKVFLTICARSASHPESSAAHTYDSALFASLLQNRSEIARHSKSPATRRHDFSSTDDFEIGQIQSGRAQCETGELVRHSYWEAHGETGQYPETTDASRALTENS